MKIVLIFSVVLLCMYSGFRIYSNWIRGVMEDKPTGTIHNQLTENNQFPEYIFNPKDTIFEKVGIDGHSEKIILGKYETDSSTYEIITKFSLIPVADGFRGKSILYVVANGSDTNIYEANERKQLPVDLYSNHLVFLNDSMVYVFSKIDLINKDIICFDSEWDFCIE